MKKELMWFGCPKCSYKPDKDKKKSNKNWNVFKVEKCPICNVEMRINFTEAVNEKN